MAFKSTMLFDVLANILKNKSSDLYEQHINSENWKDASKFMIIKYLSMHQNKNIRQIILDNQIDLERMPETILYRWLIAKIPRQNSTFIRFIR